MKNDLYFCRRCGEFVDKMNTLVGDVIELECCYCGHKEYVDAISWIAESKPEEILCGDKMD